MVLNLFNITIEIYMNIFYTRTFVKFKQQPGNEIDVKLCVYIQKLETSEKRGVKLRKCTTNKNLNTNDLKQNQK